MENGERQGYNTRRQNLILEFFRHKPQCHCTADELCAALNGEGVSRSTVYRTLNKLVKDKTLVKYSLGRGVGACYRYCSEQQNDTAYHFICTSCGAVEHLNCGMLDSLRRHLNSDHNLEIDRSLTVLYGRCARCLGK